MSAQQHLRIGAWTVNTQTGWMRHGQQKHRLQPRQLAVLSYLADRPGQVVTHAELLAAAWPGLVVEDQAVYRVVAELRRALDNDEPGVGAIETIPKRGYCLRAKVARPGPIRHRSAILMVSLGAILMLAGLAWWHLTRQEIQRGGSPSLAVLPFVAMNGPAQEALADGLTEEIIARVAQLPGLRVTARTSSFEYRGFEGDLRQVASRLGVDYLLEGSMRQDGAMLRVTAQLIDGQSGDHVWAHSWDREFRSVLAIQSQLAEQVATQLQLGFHAGDDNTVVNPEAYRLVQQGRRHRRNWQMEEAIAAFERATVLDPGMAQAWAGLATVYAQRNRYSDDGALMDAIVTPLAQRALELHPGLPEAIAALAAVAQTDNRPLEAMSALERAISGDPSNVEWRLWLSDLLRDFGYLTRALELAREAYGIDPLNPPALSRLAWSHYRLGEPEQALHFARIHNELILGSRPSTIKLMALSLAELQRWDELGRFIADHRQAFDEGVTSAFRAAQRSVVTGSASAQRDPDSTGKVTLFPMERASLVSDYSGALDLGFSLLESGEWVVPSSFWTPLLAPLRPDARFVELLHRHPLGMENVWSERGWPDLCGPDPDSVIRCW